MPIIPPGFAEVTAVYTCTVGLHVCNNSVGVELDNPLTQADVDLISDTLDGAYKAQLNGGDTYRGVRVLEGQDGPPLVWESASSAGAGTRSAALAAPMCQGLLKKTTALSGRKFRGRMFIPDMSEGDVGDVGTLDSTAVARLQAIGDAWLGIVAAVTPIIGLRLLHNDSTAPTPHLAPVAQTKAATLRRRYKR